MYVFCQGFYKQTSRRGPVQNGKDADGSYNLGEAKPLKRGNFSGHGSQEVRFIIYLVQFALDVFPHRALESEI